MLNTYFNKNVPEIQGLLYDNEKAQKNNGCDFFFQFRKGKTKLSKMVWFGQKIQSKIDETNLWLLKKVSHSRVL